MRCGKCHRENPPSNAFCYACGARISGQGADAIAAAPAVVVSEPEARLVVCPRCGASNRPSMRFCKECGTAIGPVSARPRQVSQRPEPAPIAPTSQPPVPQQTASGPPPAGPGPLICQRCGGNNDINGRFCKFCGTALAAAYPAVSRENAPRSIPPRRKMRAQLVIILRNGSEGRVYPLKAESTDIGSREGVIILRDDPYLSHRHARIEQRDGNFVLRDLSSVNGIYLRIGQAVDLVDEDMILLGQQVLRFQLVPEAERKLGAAMQHGVMIFGTPETQRLARLVQYTTEGLERDVYYLNREETVLGREQADVVFPDDPFLSRRHAAISMNREKMRFILRDLDSSNGTAVRCQGERVLKPGDQFRLGRHLFRFDLVLDTGEEPDPR